MESSANRKLGCAAPLSGGKRVSGRCAFLSETRERRPLRSPASANRLSELGTRLPAWLLWAPSSAPGPSLTCPSGTFPGGPRDPRCTGAAPSSLSWAESRQGLLSGLQGLSRCIVEQVPRPGGGGVGRDWSPWPTDLLCLPPSWQAAEACCPDRERFLPWSV